jgi:undecaprenyl-diphosphatase
LNPVSIFQILLLALIQGAAEMLPVSSSAHVIVAEKLMGHDPSSPQMVLLLVMLHTGSMFAVLAYFWRPWRENYFQSGKGRRAFLVRVAAATACTLALGLGLVFLLEHFCLPQGHKKAEVEDLFGNLGLIAAALAAVGALIIYAGIKTGRVNEKTEKEPDLKEACLIGLVQAVCLPFRGFSRSGATISAGLLMGGAKKRVEEFSFALAVLITPPALAKEGKRLWDLLAAEHANAAAFILPSLWPCLLGLVFSFVAALAALHCLSRWLEAGRWHIFGVYCLAASAVVLWLHLRGY